MINRIIALILIPVFLFSNLVSAGELADAKTSTLAPRYISEILDEYDSELAEPATNVMPAQDDKARDIERARRFQEEWTARTAGLLADKMTARVDELKGEVSLGEAEEELFYRVRTRTRRGTPRHRRDKFGAALKTEFAIRASAAGAAVNQDWPLMGKGFTVRDVNNVQITPWQNNEEFRLALAALKDKLKKTTMYSSLRNDLLRTISDFESCQDGSRRMGITPAVYDNPDRYYLGFGTTRTIGLAPEFFDKESPFFDYRLEALLHEVFHAWRDRRREDDDIEKDSNTDPIAAPAHLDAMRLGAELFWGPWDREKLEEIRTSDAVALKKHPRNEFGKVIIQWKRDQHNTAELMKRDDWKKLLKNLGPLLKRPKSKLEDLLDLLHSCDVAASSPENRNFPVQSRWPILRAVTLLEKEQRDKLVEILNRPEYGSLRKDLPVIDSILLMLERKAPENWLNLLFPNMEGRNIWLASSEIWYPGGGLGRVMQFLAASMHILLGRHKDRLGTIEPDYQKHRDEKGDLIPMDYKSHKVLTHPIVTDFEEVERFQMPMDDKDVEVVVRRGYNDLGIAVYLIKDKEGFYTNSLYNYNEGNDPSLPTREQFTEFMSRATLEFVRRQEEKAYSKDPANWKGPVLHVNDSQFSLTPIDILSDSYKDEDGVVKKYSDNPLIKKLMPAFTTHTYPDRNFGGWLYAPGKLNASHVSLSMWDLFKRKGDGFVDFFDYTSAALRGTTKLHGRTFGVSDRLVKDVARFDDWAGVNLVSVTNGGDPEWTAKAFIAIASELAASGQYQDIFPDKTMDYYEMNAEQIALTRREAKKRLRFEEGQYYTSSPEKDGSILNPDQETAVYIGRLVDWKCGRMRALSDGNILKLIERGVQVVICGNVQNTEESEQIAREIEDLAEKLRGKGPGKLVFIPSFDSTDQQAVLAATDIGIVDSDPRKEAAGATEIGFMSVGAVVLAPPWEGGEGILVDQGIPLNLEIFGEGCILVPDIKVPERDFWRVTQKDDPLRAAVEKAYFDKLASFLDLKQEDKNLYHRTSLCLDKVLISLLTAAENLRQYSMAVAEMEAAEAGETVRASASGAEGKVWLRKTEPGNIADEDILKHIEEAHQISLDDIGILIPILKNGIVDFTYLKTWYDIQTDTDSDSSEDGRRRSFEKMISGKYLGEITRLILKDLIDRKMLFNGQNCAALDIKAEYMSRIEADSSDDLVKVSELLIELGINGSSIKDRRLVKGVCDVVSARAARLIAAAILAITAKTDLELSQEHVVALDGSLSVFANKIKSNLLELLGDNALRIKVVTANDGTGITAATIAAAASSSDSRASTSGITLASTVEDVRRAMRGIASHMALYPDVSVERSKIAIITRKSWIDKETRAKEIAERSAGDLTSQVLLEHNLRVMIEDLPKNYPYDDNIIGVSDGVELINKMNELIQKGLKVVVLDDGTLSDGIEAEKGRISGQAGTDYCVVSTDLSTEIDPSKIKFVNLNAMALMGAAIISDNKYLFEKAYKMFSGAKDLPPGLITTDNKISWLIKALPRSAPFDINKESDKKLLRDLFASAA